MDYTFLADLVNEISLPEKGILSNVLHKDKHVNITAFGFAAGQELSAHSAPTPAAMYFLEGEAEVRLGDDTVCFQLLGGLDKMPASVASPSADQNQSLCNCPVCGRAMRVVERLSAAQLLSRSPPQPQRHAA